MERSDPLSGGKRAAGKVTAEPPDFVFFAQGAKRVGLYDFAKSVGVEDPLWELSACCVMQFFHAEAIRKGARLRWVNWPPASQEIISRFEELANREVMLEGL